MISVPQALASERKLAAPMPEVDFALVLSRVIESANADPAQLRNIVYELARVKLQREVLQRVNPLETKHLARALESAIERVETVHSKHDNLKAIQSLDRLTDSSEDSVKPRNRGLVINQTSPILDANHSCSIRETGTCRAPGRAWLWPGAAPLLRAATVVIFAVVVSVVMDHQFDLLGSRALQSVAPVVQKIERVGSKQVTQTPGQASPTTTPPPKSFGFPLPSVYGIYAVSGGRLQELESLVGRVPDQRVFMSTPIRTPSRTVLPDGRVEFIVYRRDTANNVPDRITVRVIAKILRAMTFNMAGQASMTNMEDSWTIRNVSYDFRVAPLGENSEMLVIRPENVDFVFPAGRYALVIKGQAYDFTVAGPITEAAQCLESVNAANGTFYSECGRSNEKKRMTSAAQRRD
jgi:hypothetical protein